MNAHPAAESAQDSHSGDKDPSLFQSEDSLRFIEIFAIEEMMGHGVEDRTQCDP